MTAVAGVVHEGRVYIGADSGGVSGWDLVIRRDPKVFTSGPFVTGFTSSFRMGQLLQYALVPPQHPEDLDPFAYMATLFVDAIRTCLKAGGLAKTENSVESGGTFLVGYRARLFEIADDFQVGEAADGYAAIGSGAPVLHGSLFATPDEPPTERLLRALSAAEHHNIGVRGPFTVAMEPEAGP